ncbi:MAG: DUF1648 domain-containing protein [Janibacter sp.]
MSRDTTRGSARDSDGPTTLRPAVPWLVVMLALGLVAVLTGAVRVDELPDPYPVHFGLAGDPDRFADRSLGTVLMPAVVGQVAGLAVFAMLLLVRAQGHRRVVTPLAALGGVIGGGMALTSIAQYLSEDAVAPPWTFWALLLGTAVATVWVVAASVRAGRESTDDREGWMWGGLVYANSEDADVFVPKHTGVGTTINFGQPLGWLVMAAILLPGIILVVGVTLWT